MRQFHSLIATNLPKWCGNYITYIVVYSNSMIIVIIESQDYVYQKGEYLGT